MISVQDDANDRLCMHVRGFHDRLARSELKRHVPLGTRDRGKALDTRFLVSCVPCRQRVLQNVKSGACCIVAGWQQLQVNQCSRFQVPPCLCPLTNILLPNLIVWLVLAIKPFFFHQLTGLSVHLEKKISIFWTLAYRLP